MAYATVEDVQERLMYSLNGQQQTICGALLDDAAVLIDSYNANADADIKKVVSCRMVARALGDGQPSGIPAGASQGSMSALGYSQSWTISNGSAGEVYLAKAERRMLGSGNAIGSWSPVEEFVSNPLEDGWSS